MKSVKKSWVLGVCSSAVVLVFFVLTEGAWAQKGQGKGQGQSQTSIPKCTDGGKEIGIDNAQVLRWKTNTPNQYLSRAMVEGTLESMGQGPASHERFMIRLGAAKDAILEVVYNVAFGKLPALQAGMNVVACGDYITSNQDTKKYKASPAGAIIHWVHVNPKPGGHEHGFLVINGKLYGWDTSGPGVRRLFPYFEIFNNPILNPEFAN